jgi:L-ascorbate metabolism protein UlaG (beta-lactamase superfamily)
MKKINMLKKIVLFSLMAATIVTLVLGCTAMGTSPSPEKVKTFYKSKQYNKKREKFENRRPELTEKEREKMNLFSLTWKWLMGVGKGTPDEKLPEEKIDLNTFLGNTDRVKFIWLGHSSLLINLEGKIILVDPMFSKYASPISFIGRRFQDPIIKLEDLPKIDLILISHDHYDHLDMDTVKFFKEKDITFVMPLGVGSHLEGWGIDKNKIIERDWWGAFSFKGIEFIAAPSQHFSGRGLSDENKSLWASWVIKTKKHNIYFSGDSGYDIHFKTIGDKYGPFDIAFMENGQYNEKWKAVHMLPEDVAVAYKELKAKKVFPIHWGMFELGFHSWYEPPARLYKALDGKEDFIAPKIGVLYDLKQPPKVKRWWESFLN